MSGLSATEAVEKTLKEFAQYALSFLAAMMLFNAVEKSTEKFRTKLWRQWVLVFIVLTISMGLLSLIYTLDPNDG